MKNELLVPTISTHKPLCTASWNPETLRGIYECRPVHQAIARSVLGSTDVLYVHVS